MHEKGVIAMLKRILLCLIVLTLSVSHAFAEEWTYLGRYITQKNLFYESTTDALILNHLFPYQNQATDTHQLYDVYYFHNHNEDIREVNEIVNLITVPVKAKIVPLNVYGKPMYSDGVFCGQIFSDVYIRNAGIFGVTPTAFSIKDSVSGKTIFRMTGEMQGQILWDGTAASKIVEITGPHKDWPQPINGAPIESFH